MSAPAQESPGTDSLALKISLIAAGVFLVARPIAFQFTPYTAETAFAGATAIIAAMTAWLAARHASHTISIEAPAKIILAPVLLWLALVVCATIRSPNLGLAIPRATELTLGVMLFFCAYIFVTLNRNLGPALIRIILAVCILLSFWGIWQKHVQYPLLWEQIHSGSVALPEDLQSSSGNKWLYSGEPDATFGNANSYAAFLILGILLHVGILLGRFQNLAGTHQAGHALALGTQLYAFASTGSKGGWVALLFGAGILLAQKIATTPARTRWLIILIGTTVGALIAILVLATLNILPQKWFGYSMFVRFEYWMTGGGILREHFPMGAGLGSFGEWYNTFKTQMATETKETHNDWWQFAIEMGVLAPIVWGAFWFGVLKSKPADAQLDPENKASAHSTKLLIIGALTALPLMYLSFGSLEASEIGSLLSGESHSRATFIRACGPILAIVILFVAYRLFSRAGQAAPESEGTIVHAARAGIAAILVHQLVDFDHTAQALMAEMFLLAGMLAALRTTDREQPRPKFSKWLHAPALLAFAAIPSALWIPLQSGIPRVNAAALEDWYRDQRVKIASMNPQSSETTQAVKYMLEDLELAVRNREDASRHAPFDAQAHFDLANVYLLLARTGRQTWSPGPTSANSQPIEQLILEQLRAAETQRPGWTAPSMMRGHFELGRGVRAKNENRDTEALEYFKQAEQAYQTAKRRYFFNPMIDISTGDALLLQGNWDQAAAHYSGAWMTDQHIYDPNTRLSAIFYDLKAGCLTKHSQDPLILKLIDLKLAAEAKSTEQTQAWLLRKLMALAWLKTQPKPPAGIDAQMLDVCTKLKECLPNHAHAAFFYAAGLQMADPKNPEIEKAWKEVDDMRHGEQQTLLPCPELVIRETREYLKK